MEDNYNAILCEGAAEEAIITRLLEADCLVIKNDNYLIENSPIRVRSAQNFCDRYLGKNFEGKVNVYRIIDSKNEKFSFKSKRYEKIYAEKLNIKNVITPPEIEMLIIIDQDHLKKYNQSSIKKPSDYCKQVLKISNVKEFEFVYHYFNDITRLVFAIKVVHRLKRKTLSEVDHTLFELMKEEFKYI